MNDVRSAIFLPLLMLSACKRDANTENGNYLTIDSITTNNLIREVIEEISNNYADEVTREKLEEGAINGMLAFLDEHSVYINSEEFESFNKLARGSYLGIGVEIKQSKDGIEIISMIDDSPAFEAGLKVGDMITHIDDADISEMSTKDVYSKLGGEFPNSKIRISITRNKNEKIEAELKNTVIQLKTVKSSLVEDIGIIKISYFNENTLDSLKAAVKDLCKKNFIEGLIIDLRNNPGGILEQAIGVAELFLPARSRIVEFKSRNIDESRIVYSESEDIFEGKPIAVLIDKNSASGAELVAAALGENKRAVIIGEKSYGKGSLQTIIPIPGKGAIKLTTSFLYSPNGNKLNNNGVPPDILVESEPIETEQQVDILKRAVDLIHGIMALNVAPIKNTVR
ncbi:MAG: S41 family peptidase [Holosporales bacterium]|nr:S41 family peptidase [Holosporales bacterium]